MSQQINLLVRKRTYGVLAWAPLALPGLALILMLGLWVQGQGELASVRVAEAASSRQLQEANGALEARRQRAGTDVVAEVAALKARAEVAQRLLAQAADLGSQQGYARYFSSLATIAEKGLWLTQVSIGGGGKNLSVSGMALRRESVVRYAQRLNTVVAGDDKQFSALELGSESSGKPGSAVPQATAVPFRIATTGASIR